MNWDQYQENIGILGLQGSGKTTLAKNFLNGVPSRPRLIISPQIPLKLYGQYGNPINDLDDLKPNGAFVWTDYSFHDPQEFIDRISKKVMTFKNFLMVVDDAHEFCNKQKMPDEWKRLINSGRNRGITSIILSPAPNLLHNVLLQSCQHLISFKFALESQVEYARKNFFGDSGFLLLPQNVRPDIYQQYDQMKKHEFLYRSVNETKIKFYFEDGNFIEMDSIKDFTRKQGPEEKEEEIQENQGPEEKEEEIQENQGPEEKEEEDNKIIDDEDD